LNSFSFIGGRFDTTFLDDRFPMMEEERAYHQEVATIAAALLTHQRRQKAMVRLVSPKTPLDSPWKQYGRREAMTR